MAVSAKPMRVLHVIHTLSMGGGEYHLVQNAAGLKSRGCDVRVMCVSRNERLRAALVAAGVEAVPVRTSRLPLFGSALSFARALLAQCRGWKPDIVCANTLTTAAVAACLRRAFQGKLVYAVMVVRRDRRVVPLLRFIYRRLDAVFYNSRYTQDSYRSLFSYSLPEFVNFSTVDDPRPSLMSLEWRNERRRILLGAGDKLVGFVGRIHPEKGVMDFLRMAEILLARNPSFRFVLIGAKDEKFPEFAQEVEDFARQKLSGAVAFLGHIAEAASHMALLDCLVNPTYGEGFGRVALEAAYLGTPIVATEPGGMTEILEGNDRSRMVPWHRPDLMANAVMALLASYPYEQSREGDAAAQARFSPAALVDRELAVLCELAGRGKGL